MNPTIPPSAIPSSSRCGILMLRQDDSFSCHQVDGDALSTRVHPEGHLLQATDNLSRFEKDLLEQMSSIIVTRKLSTKTPYGQKKGRRRRVSSETPPPHKFEPSLDQTSAEPCKGPIDESTENEALQSPKKLSCLHPKSKEAHDMKLTIPRGAKTSNVATLDKVRGFPVDSLVNTMPRWSSQGTNMDILQLGCNEGCSDKLVLPTTLLTHRSDVAIPPSRKTKLVLCKQQSSSQRHLVARRPWTTTDDQDFCATLRRAEYWKGQQLRATKRVAHLERQKEQLQRRLQHLETAVMDRLAHMMDTTTTTTTATC